MKEVIYSESFSLLYVHFYYCRLHCFSFQLDSFLKCCLLVGLVTYLATSFIRESSCNWSL